MNGVFGEFIRGHRKRLGLTQEDLAQKMDVSQPTVSTWETGESMPEHDNMQLLAQVLEISRRELVDHLIGDSAGTNCVERAIAEDDANLSRKEQKALLAAYGELAERRSVQLASAFVWTEPPDIGTA
ncbi:MAG TPA: helix-turn-helix transcriptional regulator [Nocardioidaceae bacterium]|nr:helix-turn-helix transcriptional regulator [Nocardioidaceae bacterium]